MELLERLEEAEGQVTDLAHKAKSAPLKLAMYFVARLMEEAAIEITRLRKGGSKCE